MKKRILAGIFAAIMLAGSLAGCGQKTADTGAEGGQINLRFSFWEPSTGKETETAFAEEIRLYGRGGNGLRFLPAVLQAYPGTEVCVQSAQCSAQGPR